MYKLFAQVWVSQASATQRSGRAGRVCAGVCYRLYSKDVHAQLRSHTIPEIKRAPLEDLILQIQLLELGDPGVLELGDLCWNWAIQVCW